MPAYQSLSWLARLQNCDKCLALAYASASSSANVVVLTSIPSAIAVTPSELGGAKIHLGPAAFADDETLARTLGHEWIHVLQLRALEAGSVPLPAPALPGRSECPHVED